MSDTNAQRLAIADDQVGPGGKIKLTPPQQRYLRQVLRLSAGNTFIALLERPLAQSRSVGWASSPTETSAAAGRGVDSAIAPPAGGSLQNSLENITDITDGQDAHTTGETHITGGQEAHPTGELVGKQVLIGGRQDAHPTGELGGEQVLGGRQDAHPIGDWASHWWLAQLDESPEVAWLREPRPEPAELPCRVILVAALPKGTGFEEVVRQAVELGVTDIFPVLSERTLLRPGAGRVDRWRRIVREAAEQAERAIVPSLADPLPLADLLTQLPTTDTSAYWCDPRRGAPALGDRLAQLAARSGPIALATGPEGGWSEAETAAAIAAGWAIVSLGGRILRAVTAPVVAIALVAAWAEGTAAASNSSATGFD